MATTRFTSLVSALKIFHKQKLYIRNTVDPVSVCRTHVELDPSAERVRDSEGSIVNGVEYVY